MDGLLLLNDAEFFSMHCSMIMLAECPIALEALRMPPAHCNNYKTVCMYEHHCYDRRIVHFIHALTGILCSGNKPEKQAKRTD